MTTQHLRAPSAQWSRLSPMNPCNLGLRVLHYARSFYIIISDQITNGDSDQFKIFSSSRYLDCQGHNSLNFALIFKIFVAKNMHQLSKTYNSYLLNIHVAHARVARNISMKNENYKIWKMDFPAACVLIFPLNLCLRI